MSSGIQASTKKVAAIAELPFPKSKKGKPSFLGALNYYGRLFQNLAVYGAVLYQLKDVESNLEVTCHVSQGIIRRAQETGRRNSDSPLLRLGERAAQCEAAPVPFCGRVLNENEIGYHPAETEVEITQLPQASITPLIGLDESSKHLAPFSKDSAMVRMDPELLYGRVPADFSGHVLFFDGSVENRELWR
ncbi:hypothetical protein PC123_g3663 [Phytophthora cactorum]|nr:hypothetical protein PC123_g3663 [Phytophthora cactorum]